MPSPSSPRRQTLRRALLFGFLLALLVAALQAAPGSRARDAESGTGGTTAYAQAVPDINVRDARASEPDAGSTNMVFTVTLSEPSAQTVSVNFTTADDTLGANPATASTDYTTTSGQSAAG